MVTLSGPSGVTAKTPLRMGVECMIPAPGCVCGTESTREPACRSVIDLGAPRTTVAMSSKGVPSPRANTALVSGVAGGPGRFAEGWNSAACTERVLLPSPCSEKVTLRSVNAVAEGEEGKGNMPCCMGYAVLAFLRAPLMKECSRSVVAGRADLRGVSLEGIVDGEGKGVGARSRRWNSAQTRPLTVSPTVSRSQNAL